MVSHDERRRERMQIVIASLKKSKNPDIDKLIAIGSVEWNCSRRTMLEYIKVAKAYLR